MNAGTLNDVQGGNDEFARAFLTCPQITLDHAVKVLDEKYGGIPMWITEFNVIGYYRIGNPNDEKEDGEITPADQWIADTANTPWNALYQAGFWLTAMQHPEAIEILNHHSVLNVDLGWGLGLPYSTDASRLTATGQLFAHLSHLGADADEVHLLNLENNPTLANAFGGNQASALHGIAVTNDNTLSLIIINRDADQLELKLPELGATRAHIVTYRGDEQHEHMALVKLNDPDAPVWTQGLMSPSIRFHNLADDQDGINLPGFSLSVITINK
ncbi:MAG: hypothetical protein RIG82_07975 [Phycisphaeraceae bacterium]